MCKDFIKKQWPATGPQSPHQCKKGKAIQKMCDKWVTLNLYSKIRSNKLNSTISLHFNTTHNNLKMKKQFLLFVAAIIMACSQRASAQSVTISASTPDTVCAGTSVTFTATAVGGGTYGFIWNVNGTFVGTSSATYSTTSLATGADMVHCLLTNAAGDTILAISDTINMFVGSLPAIAPISGYDSLCIGSSLTLSDATPGGAWVSSNSTAATVGTDGTVTGVSLPIGGGGTPSVRIYYIMTNGCGSDSARLRVYLAAPASAIIAPFTTICIDSSVILLDSARGGAWTSNDVTIASFGAAGPPPPSRLTGLAAGTVTITYDLTNACGSFEKTIDITVINCDTSIVTGVGNLTIDNATNIYPNPSAGSFVIPASMLAGGHAQCVITDIMGNVIKSFTLETAEATNVALNVPSGIYFVSVTSSRSKRVSRLVITQ